MNRLILLLTLLFSLAVVHAQEKEVMISGTVINAQNNNPLEGVNIINISQIKGSASNAKGYFTITAKANDTLHFSHLGFKSIKVRVTNDWLKYGNTTIGLTELALALEEIVLNQLRLTGFLKVDIEQVDVNRGAQYKISGLPTGYEGGNIKENKVNKILSSIFNPADFLYNMFGNKPRELKKLKEMKKDDEIRNVLASRFDREMLTVLLKIDKVDLDEIVKQCNYSTDFINNANDLQILDAISECYEEYKVLSRGRQ